MHNPSTGLRVTLRRLGRRPAFALTTILVLAIGVGVNLAVFAAAYALLWRPLPFPDADRLVTLSAVDRDGATRSGTVLTGTQAAAIRQHVPSVVHVGLIASAPRVTLLPGADVIDLSSARANSEYFRALGVRPLAGQFFSDQDDRGEGDGTSVVLSEAVWSRYFGRDVTVVGRVIEGQVGAARRQLRIVGIASGAATLPFSVGAEVFVPMAWRTVAFERNNRDALQQCVLRATAGVGIEQVATEVRRAFDIVGAKNDSWYGVDALRVALRPPNKRVLVLLMTAALLLLVLMCANLACVFVADAAGRSHESAVMLALGASRRTLLTGYAQQAWVICLSGTVLAFALNRLARTAIVWLLPDVKTVGPELLAVGPAVVLFGLATCIVCTLSVGLPAGWRAWRVDLQGPLSYGERTSVSSGRWSTVLLAFQTGIVVVLLTVAGLVGQSLLAVLRSDPGFTAAGTIEFRASLPVPREGQTAAAFDVARLTASVPGTTDVTFATEAVVGGGGLATVMNAGDAPLGPGDPMVAFRLVGPRYFETLRARLARGRTFSDDEVRLAARVIVLNEAAARALFHGADPIGRTVHAGFLDLRSVVVGVVKEMRHEALDQPAGAVAYLPFLPVFPGSVNVVVRTEAAPAALLAALQPRLRAWNPRASMRGVARLDDTAVATVRDRVSSGSLAGCFAVLGLIISSIGLSGALSADVRRHRAEIGIRRALGAGTGSIMGLVLKRSSRILVPGTVAGLAASAGAGYVVRSLLYQVAPLDAVSWALAVLFLTVAGLLASVVPSLRAARVDPTEVLRTA